MWNILGITLLVTSILYFYDKAKKSIKQKINDMTARKIRNQELKRLYLEKERQCSLINNFTICLSIDYRVKHEFASEKKSAINKAIYSQMAEKLKRRFTEIEVRNLESMLVIMAKDFTLYDGIYGLILCMLSKIKAEVDKKYGVYMVPSITTDAFNNMPNIERVAKDHENIKHCNLVNSSCTTNTFNKKYRFLNQYKYSGKSIGEYLVLDNKNENSYFLNMVNKNLSRQLEGLGQ